MDYRKNASVDRIACPWLIKRFIDPDAKFLYVPAQEVTAVAEREGAIPYGVGGVELGHVDCRCSFESILLEYELHDAALDRLAQIVHGSRCQRGHRQDTGSGGTEGDCIWFRDGPRRE